MGKADKWRYGIVLDAGSSGTRMHVYRWLRNEIALLDPATSHSLPYLESKDKWTKKIHVGLSTFGKKPEQIGTEHLKPLLDEALRHVPSSIVSETPVFLLATAGMRLLPQHERDAVLKTVCTYVQSNTNFLIPDCGLHVQVISGVTEGLYGWVAANYLLGGFDEPEEHNHGKGHHTYGFLDMGGASAQIAFAPNATEAKKHSNDLKLMRLRTSDGKTQEHQVFVTSWLGYGVNEARRRYVEDLEHSYGNFMVEMPDPCLPVGLRLTLDGKVVDEELSQKRHFIGVGKFDECLQRTLPLLQKDVPCPDEPCLFNGIHVPAIDFDVNHFVGISQYWHTTHEIFEMSHEEKAYDFNTYQKRVKDFCEQDWTSIKAGIADKNWGKKVDQETVSDVCFRASWLISMLHDGVGIPRVGIEKTPSSKHNGTSDLIESGKEKGFLDPFQAVDQIKSTEVSWTLGKMVLYASADVPAKSGALPVGFGKNVPGIPDDFHYPGGGHLQDTSPNTNNGASSSPSDSSSSIGDQIHDTLFKSDAPHRLPGFIFFLLIMIIAIFYLCGRDRRARFFGSVFNPSKTLDGSKNAYPRTRSQFHPVSIFNRITGRRRQGSGGINYERVMEDGAGSAAGRGASDRLFDPDQFELGDMDSNNNDDNVSVSSRNFDERLSPKRDYNKSSVPVRVKTPSIDRTGLVVRTESRERLELAIPSGRSKSRNGSPNRLKS